MMDDVVRLGVNYTPSKNWFHHWLDLDLGAVGDDLDAIADLGLDHLRIFPLWELLQPNRHLIRNSAIDDVLRVTQAATERGLDVSVDVLQGHLSSFDFLPAWVSTWHRRNLFTDPQVVSAQAELVRVLGRELADQPGTIGLTLGNEFGQFAAQRHPDPQPLNARQASSWLRTLLAAAEEVWPGGVHQHCFDDDLWFVDEHPFTPRHAVEHGAMTTVHAWVFTGVAKHYGAGHPALPRFAAYLVELAAAWSDDVSRPVWLQEIGAPTPSVPSDNAADFLEETLTAVRGAQELWGVTWWCSHDVDRSLADFPELEHTLGLFDTDNRRKPAADRLASMLPLLRRRPEASTGRPALVMDTGNERDGDRRSNTAADSELFAQWLDLSLQGANPALVLASRARDDHYLAARGISEVINPSAVGLRTSHL